MFKRFFGKRTRDGSPNGSVGGEPFVRIPGREDDRVLRLYQGALPGVSRTAIHTYAVLRLVLKHHLQNHPKGKATHQFTCFYRLNNSGAILNLFLADLDCRTTSVVDPDWIAKKIDVIILQELRKAGDTKAQHPNPLGIRILFQSHESCGFWIGLMLKRLESLQEE